VGGGREEVCTGFWLGGLKERDHLEDPGIVRRIIIKMDLRDVGWGMDYIGLVRIGTSGVFLWMR